MAELSGRERVDLQAGKVLIADPRPARIAWRRRPADPPPTRSVPRLRNRLND